MEDLILLVSHEPPLTTHIHVCKLFNVNHSIILLGFRSDPGVNAEESLTDRSPFESLRNSFRMTASPAIHEHLLAYLALYRVLCHSLLFNVPKSKLTSYHVVPSKFACTKRACAPEWPSRLFLDELVLLNKMPLGARGLPIVSVSLLTSTRITVPPHL